MKKALLMLGLSAMTTGCNGSFTAGYVIKADWEQHHDEPSDIYTEDTDDVYTCVDVHGDGTYTINESGSVA